MHTVIRFAEIPSQTFMEELGRRVNEILPGSYTGPDRVGGRFSCGISSNPNWPLHSADISQSLTNLQSIIKQATDSGIHVELDIAWEQEDYRDRWLTDISFDHSLLELLTRYQIELTVTLYSTPETERELSKNDTN